MTVVIPNGQKPSLYEDWFSNNWTNVTFEDSFLATYCCHIRIYIHESDATNLGPVHRNAV